MFLKTQIFANNGLQILMIIIIISTVQVLGLFIYPYGYSIFYRTLRKFEFALLMCLKMSGFCRCQTCDVCVILI